jgi:hypothetical protein
MGVRVDRVTDPTPEGEPVEWAAPPRTRALEQSSVGYALDARQNASFAAVNRLLSQGATVRRAMGPVEVAGDTWPPGAFLVAAAEGIHARLVGLMESLGASVSALDSAPPQRSSRLRLPRIGLYQAAGGNPDEGWTRFVLEEFGFPYRRLPDQTVREGDLRADFDVIVLPDASYNSMLGGQAQGSAPAEYTGGMGPAGIDRLRAFAAAGGTIVALDTASELPMTSFGVPVRSAAPAGGDGEFFIPGSLLRIAVDQTHPVGYGMPADAAAFVAQSPVFDLPRPGEAAAGVKVIARFPARSLLLSGWLLGERALAGRPVAIETTLGAGRIILIGFRPQHRGQTHGTFKILFNALLLAAMER